MLEQHRVVLVHPAEPLDQAADRCRFRTVVGRFLHVEVVDDLADLRHHRIPHAEARRERLEGAQVPVVAEVAGVHVERNLGVSRLGAKGECRLRID